MGDSSGILPDPIYEYVRYAPTDWLEPGVAGHWGIQIPVVEARVDAGGSLLNYLSSGGFILLANIVNAADILLVVIVTLAIAIWGDRSTKFNAYDTGCLISEVVICLFRIISNNHSGSHLLIQPNIIIAYFPVVKRLCTTDRMHLAPASVDAARGHSKSASKQSFNKSIM